jgi:regulator of sirC expression with transglutaminase-like and TPR domain
MHAAKDANRNEAEPGLLDGALRIASDACPGLDWELQRRRLDELATPLLGRGLERLAAPEQAALLAERLGRDCGFRGNQKNYYAPENSFINRVLERKLGIPISLAVVYIEVARRVGVRAAGVGFPGHFLVRVEDAEQVVIVDPCSSRPLSRLALERLLSAAGGGRLKLNDAMLDATPTRHVIVRMLLNLRHIYARRGDRPQLLVTLDRLVELLPEAVEHRRDRGLLCARLGAMAVARADLAAYLQQLPHAADAAELTKLLRELPPASDAQWLN